MYTCYLSIETITGESTFCPGTHDSSSRTGLTRSQCCVFEALLQLGLVRAKLKLKGYIMGGGVFPVPFSVLVVSVTSSFLRASS
jgi:hypothetical protein